MVKMPPVISNAHNHIIDNEVDIPNDVIGLFRWRIIRTIWLKLPQYKLIDKQFVQPIKFGEVVEDRFAICCEDDCIADHVNDVFAV